MKIKIPPPLVAFIFAVFQYLLAKYLPVGEFNFFGSEVLMYTMFGIGFLIMLGSFFQFFKKKTTTNPLEPEKATILVTQGIFKYTRNPMYLSLLLFLIGYALKLGNAFNSLLLVGFVYFMNHFQIKREEQALLKLFGKQYRLYSKATRRWF